MLGELVRRRAEDGVAGSGPIERAIYVGLQMLDAHAHGKGLALHGNAAVAQKLEHVAGGVAAGQRHGRDLDALLAGGAVRGTGGQGDRTHGAGLDLDVRHAAARAHFSPGLLDLAQDVCDHAGKDIAAHVGLRVPQDLGLGTRVDELLEDEAVGRALCARLELAVRERAGSTDAELDVALRIQDSRRVVGIDDFAATGRVVAALHEQRPQARAGKRERAEKARAPRPDHDDAAIGHVTDRLGEQEGFLVHELHALLGVGPRELAKEGPLCLLARAQPGARGEGQQNVVLLARVDGAAPALEPRELALGHTELLYDGASQRGELAGIGAVELGKSDSDAGDL